MLQAGGSSNITLGALLSSSAGSVSVNATSGIAQNASITVTGSGTVDLRAGTSISMTDGVLTSSSSGNIRYAANGTLSVGALSTAGSVSLSASSITDSGTSGTTDVTANELRLVSTGTADGQGAGTSGNHLKLNVNKLAANVAGTGGLYVTEATGLQIGTLVAINVSQVGAGGTVSVGTQTTDTAQSNVASAGNLIIVTTAGSIDTLATGGAISAAGNLLIQTGGVGSNITLGATVTNTAGHTSVNAAGSIAQNANITASGSLALGKTIELIAGGAINMGALATIGSNSGNILVNAALGDVTVETINAGTGSVAITAQSGSIVDRNTTAVDIIANGLILKASGAIGASGNNLETNVNTLSLSAGAGGAYITESTGLTVDTVTVAVNRVASDATVSTPTISTVTQEDLSATGAGNLVLVTGGALTVNAGTAASNAISTANGNVLLSVTGSLDLNATLNAGSGNVSLISSAAMSLAAEGDISTTAGTVELESTGGTLTMADGAVIQTGGGSTGNIRVKASGNVTVGLLDARVSTDRSGSLTSQANWGTVSIISTGASILDNAETTVDVYAKELRLSAAATAGGIGAGGNHLETEVSKVSAQAGTGGLYLTESTAVTLGQTAAVAFNRVGVSGAATAQTPDAAQSNLTSTGNLVLVTLAGSIDTLSTGAISATGNVLLQAGGASDINANANVSSSAGSISVLAGQSVTLTAGVELRAMSVGTIDVVAGTGSVTQAADSLMTSASGAIRVLAGNSITVGDISTGGNVSLTAQGGSILDADALVGAVNDSQLNITASGLRLNASIGVGQSVNHLETTVLTVSARATSGGIYLLETDGVTVGDVSVTVNRVKTDGSITSSTVSDAAQSDLITTAGNGSIVLRSTTGSIVLTDGSGTGLAGIIGTAISASGTGSVMIQALGAAGDVTVKADILSGAGNVSVLSGRTVTFDAGADIGTSAGGMVTVRGTTGDVVMPDSTIVTGTGTVVVTAGGTLQPGVIDTTGFVSIGTSPGGTVVFNRPIDRKGDNVTVTADRLDIQAALMSDGSVLLIAPLTATPPAEIVIGGADSGTTLHLSIDEVNLLQDGFTLITFGNGQVNQSIVLQGKTATNVLAPVVFKDPLALDISGAGGHLSLEGQLQGDSLTVMGTLANTTITLLGTNVSMAGNVTLNGLIKVDSASSITASTGGTGNLLITGNVSGLTGAADTHETLSLGANGGNINVRGTISDIDALTITSAVNVTFDETVAVTGNVLINATGVVTFKNALNLTAGGTLSVRGASNVVFEKGVTVSGDVTLDVTNLALNGGADSLSTTGGVLTITSATANSNIMVSSLTTSLAMTALVDSALNLSDQTIKAIGSGFTRVVIGEASTGSVTMVGNTDLTSIKGAAVTVRGNTITVLAGAPGGAVQVPADVTLQAEGNITLNAGLSTMDINTITGKLDSVTGNVDTITVNLNTITVISNSGSLTMASATRIDSRGGDVYLKASTGMALGTINARSSDLTQRGVVDIQAGNGTVTDANANSTADIFAKAINFSGYGPSSSTTGDVLEAVADVIQITVPQGLVVRDSGADGRTYFNVMQGGQLYRQIVLEGSVTRVTQDPATLLKKDNVALLAAGIPATSSLLQPAQVPVAAAFFASGPANSVTSLQSVATYLKSAPSPCHWPVAAAAPAAPICCRTPATALRLAFGNPTFWEHLARSL